METGVGFVGPPAVATAPASGEARFKFRRVLLTRNIFLIVLCAIRLDRKTIE
jgi:hypothetical protein